MSTAGNNDIFHKAYASGNFTFIIDKNNNLYTNSNGRLYRGGSRYVKTYSNVKKAVGGDDFAIVLLDDGTLRAWGNDKYIVDSTCEYKIPSSNDDCKITKINDVKDIFAEGNIAVAVKNNGTIWSWRWQWHKHKMDPVQITGITALDGEKIVMGRGQYSTWAAILKNNGTVYTWGYNSIGQLGIGKRDNEFYQQAQKVNINNVKDIAAGSSHTLALKKDGTVWAWGSNFYNELGDGTTTNRYTPIQVSSLTNVSKIACGEYYSFAAKTDGSLYLWGRRIYLYSKSNKYKYTGKTTPFKISSNPTFKGDFIIKAFHDYYGANMDEEFKLFILKGGKLYAIKMPKCSEESECDYVEEITGLRDYTKSRHSPVIDISGGFKHIVIKRQDGTTWALGDNKNGQLGLSEIDLERSAKLMQIKKEQERGFLSTLKCRYQTERGTGSATAKCYDHEALTSGGCSSSGVITKNLPYSNAKEWICQAQKSNVAVYAWAMCCKTERSTY
ncbi:MAG: hypothetical protein N4A36_03935 [Candidatus Gracilibacteria bacterium]|jgi:alpha-tubulin suppressor-like RCC1 family protein|nr:hypothetical protein [Candidatus Gracilibacteria bacterium]